MCVGGFSRGGQNMMGKGAIFIYPGLEDNFRFFFQIDEKISS
jgi:hypothetical protein